MPGASRPFQLVQSLASRTLPSVLCLGRYRIDLSLLYGYYVSCFCNPDSAVIVDRVHLLNGATHPRETITHTYKSLTYLSQDGSKLTRSSNSRILHEPQCASYPGASAR